MSIRIRAIVYMIASTTAFAFMNFFVKYLDEFSSFQLMFFRALGTLFFTIPLIIYHRLDILGKNRRLLALRGLTGTSSLLLFFMAMKLMPMGTAVTLRYLSPIFAAIIATIWIKEVVKWPQWIFYSISFLGVFVIKGFDTDLPLSGVLIVILSGILSGLVLVIIRKIGPEEHPLIIINYFMVICCFVGLMGSLSDWLQPHGMEWLILLALGIFGFIGQLFMTKAIQMESTNLVAPMKYLEIPTTILLGIAFLGDSYLWTSIIGFGLVIIGLVANVIYKLKY